MSSNDTNRKTGSAPPWLKAAPAIFLLLWCSGFVFLKIGLAYADPLTFLALRYALVLAVLALPALILRPAWPRSARAWGHLAMVGLLLQASYFSFTYLAFKHGISAGALALVTSMQPLLIGLLAPAFANEKISLRRWAGLTLGVAGAAIVIAGKSQLDIATPAGLFYACAALLSITAGTLWERKFGTETHPIPANLIQYAVGLAVTLPLAMALEPMRVAWTTPLLLSLAYLVLANSLIAITLLLTMYRHGEASRVSALFFLVPPVTALIAFVILGETIPVLAWLGMLLAVAGIFLVTHSAKAVPATSQSLETDAINEPGSTRV
ncbi:DMT family transporter [Paralcaligenes sp. KSB-10]|uniref:DMT family transporter n=1 Tax=Paralcaligenes sp. KSB-10 TaxID=2901142 RepID=UPI001E34F891|nr:DMT family transporter [Paralcaligenes sp. KSB-10]UHL65408.1 DMT family transporter [Paralcaligenes sp. KSB-10]